MLVARWLYELVSRSTDTRDEPLDHSSTQTGNLEATLSLFTVRGSLCTRRLASPRRLSVGPQRLPPLLPLRPSLPPGLSCAFPWRGVADGLTCHALFESRFRAG